MVNELSAGREEGPGGKLVEVGEEKVNHTKLDDEWGEDVVKNEYHIEKGFECRANGAR